MGATYQQSLFALTGPTVRFGTPIPTNTMAFVPKLPSNRLSQNKYTRGQSAKMGGYKSQQSISMSGSGDELFEEIDPQKMSRNPNASAIDIMAFDLFESQEKHTEQ